MCFEIFFGWFKTAVIIFTNNPLNRSIKEEFSILVEFKEKIKKIKFLIRKGKREENTFLANCHHLIFLRSKHVLLNEKNPTLVYTF